MKRIVRVSLALGVAGALLWACAPFLSAQIPTPSRRRPATTPRPIAPGRQVADALGAGDAKLDDDTFYDSWRYTGRRGERLVITMRGQGFDAYLRFGRVENGVYGEMVFDDSSAGGTDPRIQVVLPADGEYEIRANAALPGSVGPYVLSVESDQAPTAPVAAAPAPPAPAAPAPAAQPAAAAPAAQLAEGVRERPRIASRNIEIGETLADTLTAGDPVGGDGVTFDLWKFVGAAGDNVRIALESDDFDTYVWLGRLHGGVESRLAVNDNLGRGTNSAIEIQLPESGEYLVRVSGKRRNVLGIYRLSVLRLR